MSVESLYNTNQPSAIGLRISEHEPLVWLVSILFTKEFWNRDSLIRSRANFSLLLGSQDVDAALSTVSEPEYASVGEIYRASEDFLIGNKEAKACYDAVLEDIRLGELNFYDPPADKWGEKPNHFPERDIESFSFLNWAEQQGYSISDEIVKASELIIWLERCRIEAANKETHDYPRITGNDLDRQRLEPLWELRTGILYLLGRRSRKIGDEQNYKGDGGLFEEVARYAADAHLAGELPLIGNSEDFLQLKIKPEKLIAWAASLPVNFTFLNGPAIAAIKPEHTTLDMALMYDAVRHFWGDYDLHNPNPNIAPIKKDVVTWLVQEAAKRGLADFSESRAKVIDTIIRCPEARKGGNTL